MTPAIQSAIERQLGAKVVKLSRVSGGDINQAFLAQLDRGDRVFIKTNPGADPGLFPAEAQGLQWLGEPSVLRLPKVLAVSSGLVGEPAYLVLEYLEPGPARTSFDQELGRGLAELHRNGAPNFGLDHDNFIGTLRQSNSVRDSFAEFYWDCRLSPLVRRAHELGLLQSRVCTQFDALAPRLDELLGPHEAPARLHGDLWGGNLHRDPAGHPCLIDPAVYGGHREVDLAMMQLFGGFSERVFAAYAECFPLSPGARDRVPLFQLYPLLVHVNLFGGGYVQSLERALARYV